MCTEFMHVPCCVCCLVSVSGRRGWGRRGATVDGPRCRGMGGICASLVAVGSIGERARGAPQPQGRDARFHGTTDEGQPRAVAAGERAHGEA